MSCRRRKSGFWHDGGVGKSHAREEKVALGMTAELGKVMPEKEKWLVA